MQGQGQRQRSETATGNSGQGQKAVFSDSEQLPWWHYSTEFAMGKRAKTFNVKRLTFNVMLWAASATGSGR